MSAALAPWRKPRAPHDPGKVLLDLAPAVALGDDCLSDTAMLRAEPAVFGPVASDPTVSRLVDALAAAGPRALTAIRRARSGEVMVDIDGVLVLAHSAKQDATATWKKTFGHHPLPSTKPFSWFRPPPGPPRPNRTATCATTPGAPNSQATS